MAAAASAASSPGFYDLESSIHLLGPWELFGSVLSGVRMSMKSYDHVEYTACPASALGTTGHSLCRRCIRVSRPSSLNLAVGSGNRSESAPGFFACLFKGWASPRIGLSPSSSSGSSSVTVGSFCATPEDAAELSITPVTTITIPPGNPGTKELSQILVAVWRQSRALWTPGSASTVVAAGPGLERCLPMCEPLHRCISVCIRIAAELTSPRHTVATFIRSDKGGSAVLKPTLASPSGSLGSIVINISITDGSVTVLGKRDDCRASKSQRPLPRGLKLLRQGQGWEHDVLTGPLKYGTLEVSLFVIMQTCCDVLDQRE